MRHAKSLAGVAVALCIVLSPRAFGRQEFVGPDNDAAFELSVSQEFDENANPRVVVNTSISYRRLVFFMRAQRYEARYRVYLELVDARGKRSRGEVWEETVTTGNFRETTSAALSADSRRAFAVAPGEYEATVTIEVMDTSRRFSQKETVRVVGEGTGRLDLSKPVFYTHPVDTVSTKPRAGEIAVSMCPSSGGDHAKINAGAIYGAFDAWARVGYSVVIPAATQTSSLALSARIRDARGIVVLYSRAFVGGIEGTHASLCLDVNVDRLALGRYEINVVAAVPGGAEKSESQGSFTVLFNRALLEERIGDLAELLAFVADEKEVREIVDAAPGERVRAWGDFWRKRDPTPSTESNEEFGEFLQRLKFVLTSFSKAQPGWKTDMGKTYMKNGPPDKIENRQEARMGRYIQLWYYYSKGVVYIFEDAIGTGDYRLLTTEMM